MNKNSGSNVNPQQLVLLPASDFEELLIKQDQALAMLNSKKSSSPFDDYVTQAEAITILNKKSTWLWQKRKAGQLNFKKIGRTVYYKKEDIFNLLQAP